MLNSNAPKDYGFKEIEKAGALPFELWTNEEPHDFTIHLEHPEYSSLCPRSGYPDSGRIIVDYVPSSSIVELKSFKLFINSFRDLRISHESATNEIYKKFLNEAAPKKLRVIGDFMRRGGVKTVVTVGDKDMGDYKHSVL